MNFTVQAREKAGKGVCRKLKLEGLAPGVIYGKSQQLVSVPAEKALRFIGSFKGIKEVFELVIESNGKEEKKQVVIQDYQTAPVGNRLVHVDFMEVTDETRLTVNVPIHTVGTCAAVKLGGMLQVIRRTVPVKCFAKNIPKAIEIDVTDLQFGESVHVLDLPYGEGVKPIVTGRNFTVLTISGKSGSDEEEEEGEEAAEEAAE